MPTPIFYENLLDVSVMQESSTATTRRRTKKSTASASRIKAQASVLHRWQRMGNSIFQVRMATFLWYRQDRSSDS